MTIFDKSEEYKEIRDKVNELTVLLNRERIPFMFTAIIANNEKETVYDNESLTPGQYNMELHKDYIRDMINILNGFEAVPSRSVLYETETDAIEKSFAAAKSMQDMFNEEDLIPSDMVEPIKKTRRARKKKEKETPEA